MLNYLRKESNKTFTENGAVTYRSTCSDCLDLFARIGAMRNASDEEIVNVFKRAYFENPDIAMKILFYARDIRGGLGERRIFRVIMKWLSGFSAGSVIKNVNNVAEYGRYDDVVELIDTNCKKAAVECIKKQLEADIEALYEGGEVSLLAKWLPSVNASNADTVRKARLLCRELGMSQADYRKTLTKLRARIRIIENNLREKDYTFDYSKQPSKAMFKYRNAFLRNDGERYGTFLNGVEKGETKLNTRTLMPYEVIAPMVSLSYCGRTREPHLSDEERRAMDITWNCLEDFTGGDNALAVVDTSGSMYWQGNPVPATVALSLGIYFAERNTGAFHNNFIIFSETPQLVEIKGDDIAAKAAYCESFNEVGNTDIQKVFELVLNAAVRNKVPQEELPSTLYIISDMEFDYCAEGAGATNFEYARRLYEENGYKLPQIVFWNVQSRTAQVPVTKNEQGVILVSGCTPRLFSMIMSGDYDPYAFMLEVVESERYECIAA